MPSPVAQPGEPLRRQFAIMEVFVHHSCLSYRKSSLPRLIGARIKDAFGASDPYQLTMRYAVTQSHRISLILKSDEISANRSWFLLDSK